MSDTVLIAHTGRVTGSAASRRMRRDDMIPAVVYGQGMDPISIAVNRRDLRLALSGGAGSNTILDLTIDGTVYPAIVKDMQRHPVRRSVSHVDFVQLNLAEEITVSIPVRLEGEARQVTDNGGIVDPAVDTIEVSTRPRDIPDEILIDISEMEMDSVIRLSDIPLPAGVTPLGDPDMPIVTVLITSQAEAAQAAEGEAAPEGDAAADSGD
jgi:large subunit ribosomal protein L25